MRRYLLPRTQNARCNARSADGGGGARPYCQNCPLRMVTSTDTRLVRVNRNPAQLGSQDYAPPYLVDDLNDVHTKVAPLPRWPPIHNLGPPHVSITTAAVATWVCAPELLAAGGLPFASDAQTVEWWRQGFGREFAEEFRTTGAKSAAADVLLERMRHGRVTTTRMVRWTILI